MIDRRKLTERQRLALEKCNIDGKGLEIGPSINPIAPKCQGFNVDILDHLDKKGLIKKYDGQPNIPENLENIIEEVDFVWTGQKYVELIGKKEHYDYIISSHLIEHTPNLIQHLNDCSELLKSVNGGVYSLIVPDKRYMFDCYRQLTTVKDCINNYENTATNHSKGSNVDYFLNIVKNNNQIAWTKMDACRDVSIVHGNIDAKESLGNNGYLDIHESVFTPKSFELLIRDLNELGYIDLTIKEIKEATCLGEFYVTLQKSTKKVITNNEQRIEMLKQIMEEQLFARESEMVSRYINRIIKTKEELQLKENVGCVKNFCIDYSNVWITSTNSSLQDEDLILCGWLIMNNNFEADKIYFKIGEKYFLGQLEERSDVANVFKLNNAKCGFRMCIPHKLISLKSLDLVELIAVNNEKNYFQLAIDASQIVTGTQK